MSQIVIAGTLLSIPVFALCLLNPTSFEFSSTMLALSYFTAETWIPSASTMLINSVPREIQGFTVSVYFLVSNTAGAIAIYIIDKLNQIYQAEQDPAMYG